MRTFLVTAVLTCSTGCSVLLQKGAGTASVDCSTSHAWWIVDAAVGAAATYLIATRTNDPNPLAYAPGAALLASAGVGLYKHHNCVKWREEAPPAEWERVAALRKAEEEQEAADRARDTELAKTALDVGTAVATAAANTPASTTAPAAADDGAAPAAASGDAPAPSTTVNGRPAADYYAQFLWRDKLDDRQRHWYSYLTAEVALGDALPGSSHVDVRLALQPDGSFRAHVARLGPYADGGYAHLDEADLQGRWHVEADALVLDGLGTAQGTTVNGQDGVLLHLDAYDASALLVLATSRSDL
jgi:hypothetical protein